MVIEGKKYEGDQYKFQEVVEQLFKRLQDLSLEDGYCIVFNLKTVNPILQSSDGQFFEREGDFFILQR